MKKTREAVILTRPLGVFLRGIAALFALLYLFIPDFPDASYAPLIKAAPLWILAFMAFMARDISRRTRLMLALLLSGFGDLFLSLNMDNSFALGMGAFLLAQLIFISCFWPRRQPVNALGLEIKVALGMVIFWAVFLAFWLLPLAGKDAPALTVYFSALTVMVLLALASDAPHIAKFGAVLFLISDSLIGIDRFAHAIPERHLAVMGSYYLAQAFLFWGLMRTPVRRG